MIPGIYNIENIDARLNNNEPIKKQTPAKYKCLFDSVFVNFSLFFSLFWQEFIILLYIFLN